MRCLYTNIQLGAEFSDLVDNVGKRIMVVGVQTHRYVLPRNIFWKLSRPRTNNSTLSLTVIYPLRSLDSQCKPSLH